MGRPSRKRPRNLVATASQKDVVVNHPPNAPAMFTAGSSLDSLLIASRSNTDDAMSDNITSQAGERETAEASRPDTAAPAVYHVWGDFSEADIAHDGSGLRLGVDVDVDRFGVLWLLNPESNRTPPDEGSNNGLARYTSTRPEHDPGDDTARKEAATVGPGASSSLALEPPRLVSRCINAGDDMEKKGLPVFSDNISVAYCDEALRDALSNLKDEFGDIPPTLFKRARSACNPAEAIGSGPFLNRSAAKLANMDAIMAGGLLLLSGCSSPGSGCSPCSGSSSSLPPALLSESLLTQDRRKEPARQRPAAKKLSARLNRRDGGATWLPCRMHNNGGGGGISCNEAHEGQEEEDRERWGRARGEEGEEAGAQEPVPLLLFADLCGGPGGFSEYILRRRRQLGLPAKGWGISLREDRLDGHDELRSRGAIGDDRFETGESEACEAKRGGRVLLGLSDDPGGGRVSHRDPCAWRLDRLTPWCDVSVTRGGGSTELVRDAERRAATANASQVQDAGGQRSVTATANRPKDAPLKEGPILQAMVVDGVVSKGRSSFISHAVNRERGNNPHPMETPPDDGDCCKHDTSTTQGEGTTSDTVDLDKGDASPRVAPSAASPAPACPTTTAASDEPPLLEMRIDYGADGTGNLANETNIRGFVDSVLASTGGKRLDLVVSDGGFGAARNARDQEGLVSPLVHCEALTALLLLAERGSFLCKLFEVWTEPTASLVYLLHRKFRRIAIIKPITSRPASGERYLVCTGFLAQSQDCRFTRYLHAKVRELLQGAPLHSAADERRLVAISTFPGDGGIDLVDGTGGGGAGGSDALEVAAEMKREGGFLAYLRLVNDRLARVQIDACARIIEVCSSERGRAWVFRGGNGTRGIARHGGGKGVGGEDEKEEGADGDAAVLKLFVDAWCLGGLGAVN